MSATAASCPRTRGPRRPAAGGAATTSATGFGGSARPPGLLLTRVGRAASEPRGASAQREPAITPPCRSGRRRGRRSCRRRSQQLGRPAKAAIRVRAWLRRRSWGCAVTSGKGGGGSRLPDRRRSQSPFRWALRAPFGQGQGLGGGQTALPSRGVGHFHGAGAVGARASVGMPLRSISRRPRGNIPSPAPPAQDTARPPTCDELSKVVRPTPLRRNRSGGTESEQLGHGQRRTTTSGAAAECPDQDAAGRARLSPLPEVTRAAVRNFNDRAGPRRTGPATVSTGRTARRRAEGVMQPRAGPRLASAAAAWRADRCDPCMAARKQEITGRRSNG